MGIIAQLPTSEVAEIVRRLHPRLYLNFLNRLPPEVCLKILSFLDPLSLINTARTSREWLLLSTDRKLWKQLYMMEGFRVIAAEVRQFEASLNIERSRPSEHMDEQHASKRRATPQRILPSLQADIESETADVEMSGVKQSSLFGGGLSSEPASASFDVDVPMLSPSAMSPRSPHLLKKTNSTSSLAAENRRASASSVLSHLTAPATSSSLVVVDRSDMKKKLNWQYLYSQRRRLEANWEAEKYTNFQLPHPDHPHEAHGECIYTIQHSGNYLVSGSRDRTLRIWDLDTRRLVRSPLTGHNGSVLCLQFDASPEEDLIVSGSSDASVILWRFSTGQVIQRIRKAHRESVLNVRFDKRVLVTCSKDKTIKVFNRNALHPGEPGYPVDFGADPSHYISLNNYGFDIAPSAGLPMKPAYSIIACLEGHGAAVNAVQIHGDEIVSASGDRTVKLWNWVEQSCERTLIGHSKGIACVQYDGRRIVSGSSDNEVKVFDKASGLEVASLRAHTNLVRTVQAGFGDLPYSEQEDKDHAKAVDYDYFRAVAAGEISRTQQVSRGRLRNIRNAGSSKPEDITAYGAKLPPGGGGGKYGRIVSGSYDETIIIWRRDKEGLWKAQHILRQEDAATAARVIPLRTLQAYAQLQPAQPTPVAPGLDAYTCAVVDLAVSQGPVHLLSALQAYPQLRTSNYLQVALARLAPNARAVMVNAINAASATAPINPATGMFVTSNIQISQPLPAPAFGSVAALLSATTPSTSTTNQNNQPQAITPVVVPIPPTVPQQPLAAAALHPPATALAPTQQPAHNAPHTQAGHHHNQQANMNRVFKLQFDVRRIICCSQTSTIVGWDFANGDEQIIEASRFFAPIE